MRLNGIGYYYLNYGFNFVIILFYCVSRVYSLSSSSSTDHPVNYHLNDHNQPLQGLSSSGGYQASSSSWNYAYHFNWQSTDHPNPGKGVSRFAETSDSKQYIDPPPQDRINSRNYRHADRSHRIKTNHFNHHDNKVNYHHPGTSDSSAFIENIRNEIMSSFKETLPGNFNGQHHDYRPADYGFSYPQQRNYHQNDNMFDHYGHHNIHDSLLPRNFHLPPPPPPPPPTLTHEPISSATLKRYQRSHKQHPEVSGGTSKSSSWNFNTNQGFYYRVRNVDGKKHEEQGSYGDGQRSAGPPPSWINNHHQPNNNNHNNHQLGQEINSYRGFTNSNNFVFPPNHHHHNHNQPIWFQSLNHNNQDYHRQKV